jgi:pilus assembly protein CpaF
LRGIVERIVTPVGRRVDEAAPMVDARLPDGSRVNVVIPPIAVGGTAVTIRRFGRRRLGAADLLAGGALDARMLEFLRMCVAHRRNLLVSGGTGSGKTTLLNILSSLIPREERVVTIEDSAELAFDHPNLVSLETRTRNIEGRGEVSIRDLVRNALRMRPDRIVVGECRGGESLDMLQAMNTGHDGSMTTIHANSARDGISRLENMVAMAGIEMPLKAVRAQIASAVNLIVQASRLQDGSRRMTSITEITGMEGEVISMQEVFRYERIGMAFDGKIIGRFNATGVRSHYSDRFRQWGYDLPASIYEPLP